MTTLSSQQYTAVTFNLHTQFLLGITCNLHAKCNDFLMRFLKNIPVPEKFELKKFINLGLK